jgi:hypothetical protein
MKKKRRRKKKKKKAKKKCISLIYSMLTISEEEARRKIRQELANLVTRAQEIPGGVEELERSLTQALPRVQSEELHEEEEYQEEEEDEPPILHHQFEPKKRKRPQPWSEEETKFLLKLVCEKGAKWSLFEKEYSRGKLRDRDQTALKDKARNIMRKIIDHGNEEEWLRRYPKWQEVTVGQTRRGVHAYDGVIPDRRQKKDIYDEMIED